MGRSLAFRYDQVKPLLDHPSGEELKNKIANLKKGDCFRLVMADNVVVSLDDLPLLRCPSTYGYESVPLDEDIVYMVEENNEEPGLELKTGLRSIRFRKANHPDFQFPTHRLLTDGTLRECEALGLALIIKDIEICSYKIDRSI